jgi:hypothetical protein
MLTAQNRTGFSEIVDNKINYTPRANFSGIDKFIYTIRDSQGSKANATVTINISNINDIPTLPVLESPEDNYVYTNADNSLTLSWQESVDVDRDTVYYNVYLRTEGSDFSLHQKTMNEESEVTNLQDNTTYYWKVSATDNINETANTTARSFTYYLDSVPVIHNYSPLEDTITMKENESFTFTVNASDPEGSDLFYEWIKKIGSHTSSYSGTERINFTFEPDFDDNGTYSMIVNVSDNNSNTVSHEWTVIVENLNRKPFIVSQIPNQNIDEDTDLTIDVESYFDLEFVKQ